MTDKNTFAGNYKHRSRIAPFYQQLKTRITITHPFHPRSGEQFELAQYRRSWGRECVECLDGDGRVITIPLAWTDAADQADPFVALAAGRSYFRVEDLARLAEMIGSLKSCKEIEG
jgi:hypothetical protein